MPTIGPTDNDEANDFCELSEAMKHASRAIGWAISLGKLLKQKQQFEEGLLERVTSLLPGVEPWHTLLLCIV